MAVNQQERLKFEHWLVGFTDGEGCFSVSIIKNKTTKSGWQIFPEFVITQGERSLPALRKIERYFKCGKIYINRRHDNHRENLYRYCVRSVSDLETIIVPFFEKHKLLSDKSNDFKRFNKILKIISAGKHLDQKGMRKIAEVIQTMNRKAPARFLESSETTR